MTRRYKTSWKTSRGVKRFGVSFNAPPAEEDEANRLLRNIENEEKFIEKYHATYHRLCEESKARLKYYRAALKAIQEKQAEDQALAHIDSLVGSQRLITAQMIDATELFTPRSYKDKHVPDKTCPKCGGLLIVKERRRHLRTGGDEITPFVACSMWDRTGCRHKEPFTPEIKAAIDNAVSTVNLDLGI